MILFQENNLQAAEWKDGHTLPATARGPRSTNAADWHLKVKDIEHDVSQTKNYCLTVGMQKNQLHS